MYQEHATEIQAWARRSPENMARVACMVIITAHHPFSRVREDYERVMSGDHAPLFSWKSEAWAQYQRHAKERFDRLESLYDFHYRPRGCVNAKRVTENKMLAEVVTWLGFGAVKGGFFLQLCYGLSGCIDTRNEDTFNLPKTVSRSRNWNRAKPITVYRHANEYNRKCHNLAGGTGGLWDIWCADYAHSYRGPRDDLRTPYDVSAEHCRILGVEYQPQCEEVPF